jgi:hypothetical protein
MLPMFAPVMTRLDAREPKPPELTRSRTITGHRGSLEHAGDPRAAIQPSKGVPVSRASRLRIPPSVMSSRPSMNGLA